MAVSVERLPSMILVRFSGELTTEDLIEAGEALDRLDRTPPSLSRLVDGTAIAGLRIDYAHLARFAEDRSRWSLAHAVRTAIVVESELTARFAEMYKDFLRHPQITIGVFRERQAAEQWIAAA